MGALDFLQPDVMRLGGIGSALRVAALAETSSTAVAFHVCPELAVSLACATRESSYVEYIPQMEPLIARPLRIQDGYALPREVPGHGVELGEENERYLIA